MTPERFRQIRNLFDAVLERDAASRAAYLAEACKGDEPLRAEVEGLLASHRQEAPLLDRMAARPELLTGEPGRMEGRRIDHYEILRELGRGGMGSVYLAARTDDVYRKPVALKVVRPESSSPETIERFRREREILASLDHPNIARLLDGGTTPEGLPYFVMDYVEGKPIDAYCDERQMNVADRLKLFRSVCAAVEYAHHKSVVHRDLKPGNILVTADGVPKLLDFGIAKLLRSESEAEETATFVTRAGLRLMTPEYASPEQVRGEMVGPASDIYSLGVILYELLTGHRPYRMRSRLIHEVMRVICEEEPARPSTAVTESEERLAPGEQMPVVVTPQTVSRSRDDTPAGLRRRLSGDPDRILLKALRKEPAQRYASAAAFDEDVRRHLEGLPVLAPGENAANRAWKFLLRYRVWVGVGALFLTLLATGVVKLNYPGKLILLSLLIVVPASYFVNRRRYGRQIASTIVWAGATVLVVAEVAVMLVTQLPDSGPVPTMLFFGTVDVLIGLCLVRWAFRARWAGPLRLDLTSREELHSAYTGAGVCAAVTVFVTVSTVIGWVRGRFHESIIPLAVVLLIVLMCALISVWAFFCVNRIEFRRRGALFSGIWVPWSNVESYAWREADGPFFTLKLRSRGWRRILGPIPSAVLPSTQKPLADRILKDVLAEWPGF